MNGHDETNGWSATALAWLDVGRRLQRDDPEAFEAALEIVRELAERAAAREANVRTARGTIFGMVAPVPSA